MGGAAGTGTIAAGGDPVPGAAGQAARGGSAPISDAGTDQVGGASDGSGGRPTSVDGCADLDANGIADCKENLLVNPDFKTDVMNWTEELEATLSWDAHDASGQSSSGSALVSATGVVDANSKFLGLHDAAQCLKVGASRLLTTYANAFVESGQDELGHAEVDVFFFDSDDCTGPLSSSFVTPQPLSSPVNAWIVLKAGAVTGPTTKSALVKLAISKPFRAASFRARFDNVLVKVQAP